MRVESPQPHPASLWCRTLGDLVLYRSAVDASPLMEAGKPLAVLVYVALSPGGRAGRDHVAELMWPGADLTEARHSLRQSLYRLRHAAGAPLIELRGTDLWITTGVRLDCLEAERLAADGDLARAHGLLRGNFLEGFAIPLSHEFESWAESERIRFRDEWARAAERLAEERLRGGDGPRALEIAEELAGVRPLSDGPARLVMRALAETGRHATALARFHAYAELLAREVEAEPGAELRAYASEVERYLRERPEPSAALLPFVGRAEQWSVLEGAWEAAREGKGSAHLIEGGAGLGKTRLAAELVSRVRSAGGLVLAGKCFQIEHAVPYAVIAEALGALVDREEIAGLGRAWLAEAARLLPELRERFPDLPAVGAAGSDAAKRRLHEALARCVEAVAATTPVLVVVDDAHWADAASLEVLHLLAKRLRATHALVVATYRPAELSPVARQFARSLCADRFADIVLLEPLAADDVTDLVGRLVAFEDSSVAETTGRHLHRHCGGNPLFLQELLAALDRDGTLVVRGGRWRITAGAGMANLPHTIGKLLADRVDRLAPWMRACVEALAVCGEEAPVELLAASLQLSEPRAELALSVLEEERLARRVGPGIFDLAHDELRRLVYQGIPDERRRLLHAALGLALESQGEIKRSGGAARMAQHFDQAADQERAHRYALAGAAEAGALGVADAERALLAVAEAHAPKALPPRAAALTRRGRRRVAMAMGAVVLALGSAALGFLYAPVLGGAPGYRQGTIYLASAGSSNPSHRLRWSARRGQLARVEPLGVGESWLPARLLTRRVAAMNETHEKVFAVRGRDTVQLTFGLSDDFRPEWAPDGQRMLMVRGWKASETQYRQNVFLLDSAGRIVRQLTNSAWQDSHATWAPSGTRIVFDRDSAGASSVWIADADGTNPWNVSERFGLPHVLGYPAFASDERGLVIVYADTGSQSGAAYVVDLVEQAVRPLSGVPPGMLLARPLWSPDGRWLTYITRRGDWHALWATSVDGTSGPVLLAEVAASMYPHGWMSGSRRWAASVSLQPDVVALATGRGMRASARVLGPDGEPVSSVLRWQAVDTAVAQVDDLGFVRGRSQGTTLIVARAGGTVADTSIVTVTTAPLDTLFDEDWTLGLDTARWVPFGHPRPAVVHGVSPDGRSAFFNNGDYNHGSGAVSSQTFVVGDEGLTVETEAWLPFTGQHWQNWQIALADDPFGDGPEVSGGPLSLAVGGPEPTVASQRWACAESRMPTAPPIRVDHWWHIALVVRPDGRIECWVDGRRLATTQLPAGLADRPLAIVLRGHSVGTRIYHGRVVVTRGLRY